MVNDPKWQRFAGIHAELVPVSTGNTPTVGIGGYHCDGCGKPHLALALITEDGVEISVLVDPDTGGEIAKAIVDKLGEIGNHYIALKAFRALTLVGELATMSEIECDFLDGGGLREAARLMLGEGAVVVGQVLPRRYSEQDRSRAVDAIRGINAGRKSDTEMGQMVDLIAEALGLRLGGA